MTTLAYLMCITATSIAVLVQQAVTQRASTTLPPICPTQVLQGDGSQTYLAEEHCRMTYHEAKKTTQGLVQESVAPLLQTNTNPFLIYPTQVLYGDGSQTCPSEAQGIKMLRTYHEDKKSTQELLQKSVVPLPQTQLPTVFSCGGPAGWRCVAYLNMSDPSQQCPSVWQEITIPHRVCGRRSSSGGCEGLNYTTGSEQYKQVCGRIIGYQIGVPNAFCTNKSLDDNYVNGISVTHGSPRQHIWTFAAGVDEQIDINRCPCIVGSTAARSNVPSFVGQNYFCETGITQWPGTYGVFYPDGDPLWDGQGCGPTSSCCTFNSPPWFNVRLPSSTTDGIEVRICSDESTTVDDTPIQLIELYVK